MKVAAPELPPGARTDVVDIALPLQGAGGDARVALKLQGAHAYSAHKSKCLDTKQKMCTPARNSFATKRRGQCCATTFTLAPAVTE